MTTTPATRSASVWPRPQSPPTRDELQRLLRSLTMAETAARWSASTACLRPSTKPKASTGAAERGSVGVMGRDDTESGARPPLDPVAGLHQLDGLLAPPRYLQQGGFGLRVFDVRGGVSDSVVDGYDEFRPEDYAGGGGLLRRHDYGEVARGLLRPLFDDDPVDRQEGRVEGAVLPPRLPPAAVPERVAAVDDAPPARSDDPRHLILAEAVRRGHGRDGEVAQDERLVHVERAHAEAARGDRVGHLRVADHDAGRLLEDAAYRLRVEVVVVQVRDEDGARLRLHLNGDDWVFPRAVQSLGADPGVYEDGRLAGDQLQPRPR